MKNQQLTGGGVGGERGRGYDYKIFETVFVRSSDCVLIFVTTKAATTRCGRVHQRRCLVVLVARRWGNGDLGNFSPLVPTFPH